MSPSQRPLPTQDNTTYKHKRQTSMPLAGFETAIPATKRPQTYALDLAATGIRGFPQYPGRIMGQYLKKFTTASSVISFSSLSHYVMSLNT
jgi:hypothetical protein